MVLLISQLLMLFRFFYTNILRLGITTQYVCLYGKFILNTHSKERKTQKMSVGIFFFLRKHLYCMLSFLPVQILVFESRTYLKVKAQKLKHENMGWGP